jgi:hypothetical protein
MAPDPWQAELLACPDRRMLLLCSRQSGKSQTAAALALQAALLEPPALVLLLSPTLRQSGELFKAKLIPLYDALGRPVKATQETALTLTLANGSRVLSLPGNEATIRCYSGVSLLVIDEASRVPDALYRTVRPMLAVSGGRLVALSTPFGKRGWFYEEWTSNRPWKRVRMTADQCPRIAPEFLDQEREALGDRWFAQEYLCSFEDMIGAVFAQEDIDAAMCDQLEPLVVGSAVTAPGGPRTIIGLDLGQAQDPTALVVIREAGRDAKGRTVWAVPHLQRWPLMTPYPDIVKDVADLVRCLPGSVLVIDATGVGRAVVDLFRDAGLPVAELVAVTITGGQEMSRTGPGMWSVPKKDLVGAVQSVLQSRRLKVARRQRESRTLAQELATFRVKINAATLTESFEAWRARDHDDLVVGLAMPVWLGEQPPLSLDVCEIRTTPLPRETPVAVNKYPQMIRYFSQIDAYQAVPEIDGSIVYGPDYKDQHRAAWASVCLAHLLAGEPLAGDVELDETQRGEVLGEVRAWCEKTRKKIVLSL